jgi:hypothetical protein
MAGNTRQLWFSLLSASVNHISAQYCHFCPAKFPASTCKRTAMPLTFCHPLAVLPLQRFCPAWLSFPALIIGSMSPDFGYYIGQFPMASFAHTVAGTFIVCLPTSLLMLGIVYTLWRPLCFMLPQPHRAALLALPQMKTRRINLRGALIAALSTLLGAWTHTIWDSFTHSTGWAVLHISILQLPLIKFGDTTRHAPYVLQQLSTLAGSAILIAAYISWLRQQSLVNVTQKQSSDRFRYWAITIIALTFSVPTAAEMASRFDGYMAFRVFVFRSCIYATGVFTALYVITAITIYILLYKKITLNPENPQQA